MPAGLIVLILIVAVIIIYFFGFHVFFYCAIFGISCWFLAIVYELLDTEGKTKAIKKFPKTLWKNYRMMEDKLFKWFDNL